MKALLSVFCVITATFYCYGQKFISEADKPDMNYYDVKVLFDEHFKTHDKKSGGYKQFKRWEYMVTPRMKENGDMYQRDVIYQAYKKFKNRPLPLGGADSSYWEPRGPEEWINKDNNPGLGRVNAITRHPNNPDIIYAGTPSGGIWKSYNGGAYWEPLSDFLPSLGIADIVIDPRSPDTVFVATGDSDGLNLFSIGVLVSYDGGETFEETGLTHSTSDAIVCRRIIMDPEDPNNIMVAATDGLYKSSDYGATWDLVLADDTRDVEYKPGNSQVVYATTDSHLYKSDDGGESFQTTGSSVISRYSLRLEVAVTPAAPDNVYVVSSIGGSFGGFFLSEDSGDSFQLQAKNPNLLGYSKDGSDNAGQGGYDLAIAVDPEDENHIFIGGINVWESFNAGEDWEINAHWVYTEGGKYVHADIHSLDYFGTDLYCGSDGGTYVSRTGGESWEQIDKGMQITQMYKFGVSHNNPNDIIYGTQDNGTFLQNGKDWYHVLGGDGMEAIIDYSNPNRMWGSVYFGRVFMSTDNGNSFDDLPFEYSPDGNWVSPYIQDVVNPNKLYLGNSMMYIFDFETMEMSTIDGITGDPYEVLEQSDFFPDYIYATSRSSVATSTDNGGAFEYVGMSSNYRITGMDVHPSDPLKLYASANSHTSGKCLYSEDGGKSWKDISEGLPSVSVNCIVYQRGSANGIYVGTDMGVYYRDDSLGRFIPYLDSLPLVIVNELDIHYETQTIQAATYGRGAWRSPLMQNLVGPPKSAFTSSIDEICATREVQFYNTSEHAQHFQWYFPTGTPEKSNLLHPKVNFDEDGEHEVMLISWNNEMVDTLRSSINIDDSKFRLQFLFKTDKRASQSSWKLFDEEWNQLYESVDFSSDEYVYEANYCADSSCFYVVLYDSGNNGICCNLGEGSFTIKVNDEVRFVHNGEFKSTDTLYFCSLDTEVKQANTLKNVKFYPNPMKNFVNLELPYASDYTIEVFNNVGQKVKLIQGKAYREILDFSDLEAGYYIMNIESKLGDRKHIPFVKY